MDPPEHGKYRTLMAGRFQPRALESKRAAIGTIVDEVIDRIIDQNAVDFVQAVAAIVPLAVIAEMFGLPREDWSLMFQWSNALIGPGDPEYQQGRTARETSQQTIQSFLDYFRRLSEQRRRQPGDNFVSVLAGVWAEENTREAIFDALKRKEVFATSGTRVKVRFFGGWSYPDTLAKDKALLKKGYDGGAPMGGDLPAKPANATAPKFLTWALKDPDSAPLQRLQIVKGWVKQGESQEQIFDVACSGKLKPEPQTHRCPDNGATVNLSDCSISNDKGATELSTMWTDPTFKADQRAFYYARVIENPICRWSAWDAVRNQLDLPTHLPATIQERAWSSPIWYTPVGAK
jgi:hypothetical protein